VDEHDDRNGLRDPDRPVVIESERLSGDLGVDDVGAELVERRAERDAGNLP
jgi:hypothetical protein